LNFKKKTKNTDNSKNIMTLATDFLRMLMHSINESLQMLWVGVWVNAVAKVCYVATDTKLLKHFFHFLGYLPLSITTTTTTTV